MAALSRNQRAIIGFLCSPFWRQLVRERNNYFSFNSIIIPQVLFSAALQQFDCATTARLSHKMIFPSVDKSFLTVYMKHKAALHHGSQ
ncbi:hypothetical protein [Thalassospira sp. MCCC 1A02491]|nr:hypothetical protein [Thalassospira sp. MCCC 1A02491]